MEGARVSHWQGVFSEGPSFETYRVTKIQQHVARENVGLCKVYDFEPAQSLKTRSGHIETEKTTNKETGGAILVTSS